MKGDFPTFQLSLTMPATGLPEIHVYASFPLSVTPGADLNLEHSNWRWVYCLTIPLETLTALQFSLKPYKWTRYAIGVVVGAVGHLSFSSDPLSVVDYEDGLPTKLTDLYYHTSDEEKRRMFPADPAMGRTDITSSIATSRRVYFRDEVAERDGGTCVMTGLESHNCNAVHLLAHDKGDAVCHSHSSLFSLTITPCSTSRRTLGAVVEILLGRTSFRRLTAFGTAFS